jgi:hypothetical protein
MPCGLIYSLPKGVELKSVLPRDGPVDRPTVVWRRRNILVRAPVHQTQHHSPARAWAERHHSGVVAGDPAAGCIPSVPPGGGWGRLGAGEFLAPNSPLGPPPVLLADFWVAERARNPLDFVHWVVPIKARGRYTLCSAIHRAEGVRRVRNGDFWKCV